MEPNTNQFKKCPYCAEEIRIDAKVCKFCQRDIEDTYKPIRLELTSKRYKKHIAISATLLIIGSLFSFIGFISGMFAFMSQDQSSPSFAVILLPLGILAFVIGLIWLIVTKIKMWWDMG